jgi:hypothetical protein
VFVSGSAHSFVLMRKQERQQPHGFRGAKPSSDSAHGLERDVRIVKKSHQHLLHPPVARDPTQALDHHSSARAVASITGQLQ